MTTLYPCFKSLFANVKAVTITLAITLFTQKTFAQPTISSFIPAIGVIGTSVTITGTNFNTTPASNIVYFGAVKASVSASTATTITVTVPAGATYQPISVTTSNLTAYSAKPFIVTFAGAGTSFNSSSFGSKLDSATGSQPFCITAGDFDGDGKADLISGNYGGGAVSVLRNTSTASAISFATKFNVSTTAIGPRFITVNDFDGDGKLDFAVANATTDKITIFKNTSTVNNLSFVLQLNYNASSSPEGICSGDFNSDGKPDLAFINGISNNLMIIKNTSTLGTITFDATALFYSTSSNPHSIFTSDLDADGKLDLVVANGISNNISTFKNTSASGIISFATAVNFSVGSGPYSVVVGDLDGDGKPDIANANGTGSSVSILKNTTSSGTISFATSVQYNVGSSPYSLAITDIDGDGKLDLAIANDVSNNFSILKNSSSVGNINFLTSVDYVTENGPRGIFATDLDGDGKPEIAVSNFSAGSVSVFKNQVGVVVPLSLLNFKGHLLNNSIELKWNTSNEINVKHFDIEYSVDGISFASIGNIKTLSIVNSSNNYSFTHLKIRVGVNYYRLKIVDNDGSSSYSGTIQIQFNKQNTFVIYPNPAKDFIIIEYDIIENPTDVLLIDIAGRIIKTIVLDKNSTKTKILLNALPAGIYQVIINDNYNKQSKQLVIQN